MKTELAWKSYITLFFFFLRNEHFHKEALEANLCLEVHEDWSSSLFCLKFGNQSGYDSCCCGTVGITCKGDTLVPVSASPAWAGGRFR